MKRQVQLRSRLDALLAMWEDEAAFRRIVASGRYLKLCTTLQAIEEALASAG